MCTGRLDLSMVLRSFIKGADAVIVAGCHLNECNYITHGNFYGLSVVALARKLIERVGVNPGRLRMELVSSGEGNKFAELMNQFSQEIRALGPLESGDGKVSEGLEATSRLVPYLKLALRDKLAMRFDDTAVYDGLYSAEEVEKLIDDAPSYYINPEKCRACMSCFKRCPVGAIDGGKGLIHIIDQYKCIKCGACLEACPDKFGAVERLVGKPVPPPLAEAARVLEKKAG